MQFWEVERATEYRQCSRGASVGRFYWWSAISPDSRLLAAGMDDGVGLWNLQTAAFLAFLPIGETNGMKFENNPPALLTNGPVGACRSPIAAKPKPGMRIGTPEMLSLPGSIYELDQSRGRPDHRAGGRLRRRQRARLRQFITSRSEMFLVLRRI